MGQDTLALFESWELDDGPIDPLALLASAEWSHSRRTLLEKCPRKYYYEYYGAGLRVALEEPNKTLLRRLKAIQNRHERAGTILHFVIATYFRKARQGDLWSVDRLLPWARDMFQADIRYSRSDPRGEAPPGGDFPPTLLLEFHQGLADAGGLCQETMERMLQALEHFAALPCYEPFRLVEGRTGAHIEKRFTRIKSLPCSVEGMIDLLYTEEHRTVIVDWKMGSAD